MPSKNKLADFVRRALANDPTLTKIELNDSTVTDDEVHMLVEALRNNTHVTGIFLGEGGISDKAACEIFDFLKDNKTIRLVSLPNNELGKDSAHAFARMLESNTALAHANIDITPLQGSNPKMEGMYRIAEALRNNHSLTELHIENWLSGPDSINPFSRALIATGNKNIALVRMVHKGQEDYNPAWKNEELKKYCETNKQEAKKLVDTMQHDPSSLTRTDFQEIRDRMGAILYVLQNFKRNLFHPGTVAMLTEIKSRGASYGIDIALPAWLGESAIGISAASIFAADISEKPSYPTRLDTFTADDSRRMMSHREQLNKENRSNWRHPKKVSDNSGNER